MKRILSLVMVLTMLLSAVGVMTVSAADEALALPADYPYLYLDFEETGAIPGSVAGTMGGYDSWQAGGAYGSKGSLTAKATSANAASYAEWQINIPTSFDLTATYKFSFLAKLGVESLGSLTASDAYFTGILFGGNDYKGVSFTGTLLANQWVKYEATIDMATFKHANWTVSTAYNLRLRFYGFNAVKGLQPAAQQATFELPLSLDDIIIEPVHTRAVAEDPVFDESFVTAVTYENDGADDVNGSFIVNRSGLSTAVVATPDATTAQHGNKVLKITKTAAASGYGDLNVGNLKFNHRYKISASIKPAATSGTTTLNLFNMHTAGYAGVTITDTTTGISDWPSTSKTLTNNTWNDIVFYVSNEAVTFDDGTCFLSMFRFPGGVAQNAVIYIDNIMIQDLGVVTNGDFESTVAVGDLWRPNSATATGSHNVFSWYGVNAAAATSTDVRTAVEDAETTSTKSMQVTIDANGGRVHQPVDFAHNQAYTISFWAKNPALGDGEEQDISIKLDRNDTTPDDAKDIFIYPDGAIETVAGDNWKLTNEWQKFTTTYTPSFETVGGATPAANVAPRKPYLYFDVDGNAAGTSFLIDDVKVEKYVAPPPAYPYPYATSALATSDLIAGKDATFIYTFTSETGKAERAAGSIARLLVSENGTNYASSGQFAVSGSGAFAVPEDAAGKYYKVEIFAIDADGTYGEIATIDFGQALVGFDINVTYPTWNVAGNQITANVVIQNNLPENAGEELVVILAIYSENNTLLYTSSAPVTLTGSFNNTASPVVLSGIINGAESLTAHHAKVFVWGGSALANAGDPIWKVAESYSPAA